MQFAILLLGILLCLPGRAFAQGDPRPPAAEPPQIDVPESFKPSGEWVGVYQITTRAVPTSVIVEDPFIFTIAISGSGPTKDSPRRPRLEEFPAFKEQFYIEELPELDRHDAESSTWEFSYRLRPRNLQVRRIPYVPFVYWNVTYQKYQKPYHPTIPLEVRPRTQVTAPKGVKPPPTPEHLLHLATGPEVLRREEPGRLPATWFVVLLLLIPPAGGLVWFILWRRLYPDAARLARQRRSQAARLALKELEPAGRSGKGSLPPRQVLAVLTNYLRQHFELVPEEPTPIEIARLLSERDVPEALGEKIAGFFRACHAVEFGPGLLESADRFAGDAVQLILALEDESCPSQSS